jgi:hypothetical protein
MRVWRMEDSGMKGKRLFAGVVTAVVALGGLLFAAAPAQAAPYCYIGSTVNDARQESFYDVYIYMRISYKPLLNCSRVRIGVRLVSAGASYSGGSFSSTSGIKAFGIAMKQVGGSACFPTFPHVGSLTPAVRSVSRSFSGDVYTGTYRDCFGNRYSFADTCVYIKLQKAFHIWDILFTGEFRNCIGLTGFQKDVWT